MRPPRLLDLFCGGGGCTKGYQDAGFYVVGVDIAPQPRYIGDHFIQADIMEWMQIAIDTGYIDGFDVIHASPPCQAYSITASLHTVDHPDLVQPVRELLKATGKPYIIENVPGSPLDNPLMLCGTMFPGLRVIRHRLFECWPELWFPPAQCHHWGSTGGGATGRISSFDKAEFICVAGERFRKADAEIAMGINWMLVRELCQAIPPAYTEFIGRKMLEAIQ